MSRNAIRFVGLVLLTALFLITGLSCTLHPSITATYIEQTTALFTFYQLGLDLGVPLVVMVRIVGILLMSFSVFVLLGVYRRFFAFALCVLHAVLVISLRANSPETTITPEQRIDLLKDLAIMGGLVFVAFSGKPSKFDRAKEKFEASVAKKRQ